MIDPLDDNSRGTFTGCPCAQCRPSIAEALKDLLSDANLTITFRRDPVKDPASDLKQ